MLNREIISTNLSVYLRIIRSSKQIIQRHVKIIRDGYKGLIIRLPLQCFIAAYGVLKCFKINCKAHL